VAFDRWHAPEASDRWAIIIIGALVLLPLVQLIDLPPSIWSALPGRGSISATYQEAGIALPWLPISLDSGATSRAWLSLLPAVAVFLATMHQGELTRRIVSLVIIGLGLVSVLLGLAQLMQGPESPLRLYPITNIEDSVGFFANRNHYAALLTALIPLAAVWLISSFDHRRSVRALMIAASLILYAALILGLGMARSRAGIILAIVATVGSLMLASTDGRRETHRGYRALGAAASVGGLLVAYFAFARLLGRFETSLLSDLRFTIARITGGAVADFFPVGSGFGTFEAIYRMYEPRDALMQTYVNHAHNDWLEMLLEGGAPAAIIALAFLVWFALRSSKLWRAPSEDIAVTDLLLPRAATITILLILLFSLVEYPLRTTTISVLFAWCVALLTTPVRSTYSRQTARDLPSHSRSPSHRRDGHRHRRAVSPKRPMARRWFS
jgi:O-antigen ligase